MLRKISWALILALTLTAILPAALAEPYVAVVTLNVQSMALMPGGEGRQLAVQIEPAEAAGERIYWMSSNSSVASVDNSGMVTPHAVGTTTITAETAGGISDACVVTVTNNPATSILLSKTELVMGDREAYVLDVEVGPDTADNLGVTWSSSDRSVAVVNQNGKIFSKAPGTCWISATASGGVNVVARCQVTVEPSGKPMKYVALTLDDGPCENTLEILDIFEEYDVNATFFCLGQLVETRPEVVRRAHAQGHEIANHSYSHETLTKISLDEAKEQMDKADAAIEAAIGIEASVYRAPGGSVNEKIAQHCGKPFIDWTVDTNDWKYRDPEHVWTFIARNSGNYDIVLMHDIRPTTTEGLRKAVPYLLEQGFTLITVSELLELVGGVDETLIYEP